MLRRQRALRGYCIPPSLAILVPLRVVWVSLTVRPKEPPLSFSATQLPPFSLQQVITS